jgi:HAD superfamily hydrolase (TIGR01509 family)
MKTLLSEDQKRVLESKHWIFDMDGTLTLSVHDFDLMRRELGLKPNQDILKTMEALPQEEAAPMWAKLDELECYFASLAKPMPGAYELLEQLHLRDVNLGILTRNVMPAAIQTLKICQLDQFFNVEDILDRDSCAPKPKPDGIHLLLNKWGANASESVMVGDYIFDLEAGKAAQVATIHIDTSADYPWPEYTDLGVHHLNQLLHAT